MVSFITVLTSNTATTSSASLGWTSIIWLVLLLVAFYFILIRPQRKKEKKDAEMRKNIQIGDEIVTAGGIVGIVCKLEEETLVIETGSDKSKLRIRRWAVSQNLDAEKEASAAAAAAKEARETAKENAKKKKKGEDLPIEKD
ncbi:MAG TPA: preprotein translocase subunit YajC [Candidatus Faeciplasma gallinarum]|uniref:Preprotein translocase subunit YajC n=1 Tax=Candidatus Faeciplasma gallinarum TaxID=2840799 RepID=A0A9D1EQF3_9FIRM|nr:preprotein translocase subunit YajC [Candidatus Faeciplasma gallinarum]